jgi:putative SOS response-associated peptidase YedK
MTLAEQLQYKFSVRKNVSPKTQQRSLDALQWGLIPYWAKDPKISYRTINARAEIVDKAPSFRQATVPDSCGRILRMAQNG